MFGRFPRGTPGPIGVTAGDRPGKKLVVRVMGPRSSSLRHVLPQTGSRRHVCATWISCFVLAMALESVSNTWVDTACSRRQPRRMLSFVVGVFGCLQRVGSDRRAARGSDLAAGWMD